MKKCDKCGNPVYGDAKYCICGGKALGGTYDMAKDAFGEEFAKKIFGDKKKTDV